MRIVVLPLLVTACIVVAPSCLAKEAVSEPTITAQVALSSIEEVGADAVLRRLYEGWSEQGNDDFYNVLRGIESGRRAWLVVAQKLRVVSDAGSSSMLDEAVTRAILRNPEAVLLFFGDDVGGDRVGLCQLLTVLEPKEGVLPYLRKVEKALLAVKRPSLPWRNALCLSQVRDEIAKNKASK
jgi:hypothetical protein